MEKHLPFHVKLRQERLRRGWSQEDVAVRVGVEEKTVSRWEQGKNYPRPYYLQKIFAIFEKNAEMMGAFEEGAHSAEATPRLPQAPTDPILETVAALRLPGPDEDNGSGQSAQPYNLVPREEWSQAPQVTHLYGRNEELSTLRQWMVDDCCRVVGVLGMGGVGKTALSVQLVRQIKGGFEYVFWCSLQHAPPLTAILTQCIQFVSDHQDAQVPETIEEQIILLLHYMRTRRCLLVLDNAETLLQAGQHAGHYRETFEGYGQFIQRVGETEHQSCLLLTSREKPEEIARLEGKTAPVRTLHLQGLGLVPGREILREKGLAGSDTDWATLVARYSGNPLALKLIAESVQELFGGSIASFLAEGETGFGNINELLDQQFRRLPPLEQDLLYWFACEREALSSGQLRANLAQVLANGIVLEALKSLRRRSLIEMNEPGSFLLQPVIMEYVTADLVERFISSFDTYSADPWLHYALIKAQSKDYVRDMQTRLILEPVAQRLLTMFGKEGIRRGLEDILVRQRRLSSPQRNYLAGNALNLLLALGCDLRGTDFSSLMIRQAYLQDAFLPEVNFAQSHFVESSFASTLGNILAVAASPHDDLLAAGTAMGEVWLYEVASGRPLQVCRGHSDAVWSVAFSPDGRKLASSSDDMSIRLWQTSSGHALQLLEGHSNRVKSVAFSPDGRLLASASEDQSARVWDSATGKCLMVLHEHADRVWCIAFSPDGKSLATGSTDQTVRLWDVESGRCLRVLTGHSGWVLSVAFSVDGRLLASSGDDQMIRLWECATGEACGVLKGHTSRVRSVAFSADGRKLASGSEDQRVRIWDIASGDCLAILRGHTQGVRSVTFSAPGDIVVSGGDDQTLRLWDANTGLGLKTLQGYTNRVWAVLFVPASQLLVSCSEDQTIRVWGKNCLRTIHDATHGVRALAISPNGQMIASGGEDRTVRLWNRESGACLKTLQGHSGWIRTVAFSPDGRLLASGGEDLAVRVWEVNSGRCLFILHGHKNWLRTLAFSPDLQFIASAGDDRSVRLWSVAKGDCVMVLPGHTGQVRSLAFSPDGELLASGGEDQTIRLWDLKGGHTLRELRGHTSWVRSVDFSPSGRMLATGGEDQTICLWDVESGECVNVLRGHTSRVRWVNFGADNAALASSSDDGSIKVWDIESGQCLNTLVSERPYERMDITDAQGLTDAQKNTLQALGAIIRP
ncbi:MAG TPA: NB-ARC domain-containing protein [Ktedonosporobacter sp.]|nr:NB-ARC domain-containing protein [Ktedonosporobacter sp.]